jgi:glycosyltransferase involved in cell wall biosynthesis
MQSMLRFIILTQYYPPETGAPQNRLSSLAKYLLKKGHDVNIVTALPNYPKGEVFEEYQGKYRVQETIDGVVVHRTWIFATRSSGIFKRLLNYFSFVASSFFKLLFLRKADFIICESPPLFLGITAVFISRIKGSKLVFNVSDLWPESAEKLGIVNNRFLLRLAYRLEAWVYKHSHLISGQTQGIVSSIRQRFPMKHVQWFPNGVDLDFWEQTHEQIPWRDRLGFRPDDFVVLYAGIIGHAQGLSIIPEAAELVGHLPVQFVIVGDGPVKEDLLLKVQEKGLKNVHFQPNQPKAMIPSFIKSCDAFLVPLKKLDLFLGAIPSKLFEPLAMKKPILLGVEGEAKELFVMQGKAGLSFEPENAIDLVDKLRILINDRKASSQMGERGHQFVSTNFDRERIHQRFVNSMLNIG